MFGSHVFQIEFPYEKIMFNATVIRWKERIKIQTKIEFSINIWWFEFGWTTEKRIFMNMLAELTRIRENKKQKIVWKLYLFEVSMGWQQQLEVKNTVQRMISVI